MATADKRRELLDLVLEVSFRRERVTLASGKQSDFYLDLRQTLMRPRGIALAGELVLDRLLDGPPVESVGGMAVGACRRPMRPEASSSRFRIWARAATVAVRR